MTPQNICFDKKKKKKKKKKEKKSEQRKIEKKKKSIISNTFFGSIVYSWVRVYKVHQNFLKVVILVIIINQWNQPALCTKDR